MTRPVTTPDAEAGTSRDPEALAVEARKQRGHAHRLFGPSSVADCTGGRPRLLLYEYAPYGGRDMAPGRLDRWVGRWTDRTSGGGGMQAADCCTVE